MVPKVIVQYLDSFGDLFCRFLLTIKGNTTFSKDGKTVNVSCPPNVPLNTRAVLSIIRWLVNSYDVPIVIDKINFALSEELDAIIDRITIRNSLVEVVFLVRDLSKTQGRKHQLLCRLLKEGIEKMEHAPGSSLDWVCTIQWRHWGAYGGNSNARM